MAEFLLKKGHTVTVLDNFSSGSKSNLSECFTMDNFRCISADVCDEGVAEQNSEGCDVIIHLAASVGVRNILADPLGCIENNLHSTEKVLKAAQKNSCRVFIASSSEVYGKQTHNRLCETDNSCLGSTEYSRWSYAAAKVMDEHLALGFSRQRGLNVVIGRFFNVAGARQSSAYGMVIPRFISQAVCGEPLTVYGDGHQVRTFCSVHDVVRAVWMLCNAEDMCGGIFNIGAEGTITIQELAAKIVKLAQSTSVIEYIPESSLPAGFDDTNYRCPDIRKIFRAVGWKPEKSLDEILETALHDYIQIDRVNSGTVQNEMSGF
jgi:UDP-glucose 4-epimerase